MMALSVGGGLALQVGSKVQGRPGGDRSGINVYRALFKELELGR